MWRIIDVSGEDYKLICSQDNLVVIKNEEEKLRAHLSDINTIIIHSYSINLTGVLIQKLIDYNIPLILCDRAHNPSGILLQLFKHTEYGNRLYLQIKTSKPLLKKAWQQIIKAKIKNQSEVLKEFGKNRESELLLKYSYEVKSGDKTNRESIASRVYFQALFENFNRTPDSNDIINSSLNYSYAVLRSNIARAIVGSGLNPSMGIFHSYKNNYFCLVDDLMESLRPFIDRHIRQNISEIKKHKELNSEIKKLLVSITDYNFSYNNEKINLVNISQRYVFSYISYLSKETKKINIPVL